MAEDWITTNEAADLSGYHPDYIRKLLQGGKLNGRKFGPVWQVSKQSLLAYVARAEQADDKRLGPK
jgi:excisionase family DNA binding protein